MEATPPSPSVYPDVQPPELSESAVFVSFRWGGLGATPADAARHLLERRIRVPRAPSERVPDGGTHAWPVWEQALDEPNGVGELTPALQALLDVRGATKSPWTWRRLKLSRQVRSLVFEKPTIGREKATESPGRIGAFGVEAVEVMLLPMGHGIVSVSADWCRGGPRRIEELLTGLSYLRHVRAPSGLATWTLGPREASSERPLQGLGRLAQVIHEGGQIDLASIVHALLVGDDERQPDLVDESRLGVVHSVVRLTAEPPAEQLNGLLFHLRRGYEPSYLVPRSAISDIVHEPRTNRRIGISREGVACVTWPDPRGSARFEQEWPRRFMRVYLLLHVHVHAERLALAELAANASGFVLDLEIRDLRSRRAEIEELVVELTRYTITLTGEDCGGPTEYAEFFSAVRTVHNIGPQRDELRAEIAELNALLQAAEEQLERRFQHYISSFVSITLPLGLVLAFFGANIAGPSGQIAFTWDVVLASCLGAVGAGSAFSFISMRDPRPRIRSKGKKQLKLERKTRRGGRA